MSKESESIETETQTTGRGLKAKKASLISKIVAGVILLVGAVLKWLDIFNNCEITELCTVAGTMTALFSTVDINLMLEKFSKN